MRDSPFGSIRKGDVVRDTKRRAHDGEQEVWIMKFEMGNWYKHESGTVLFVGGAMRSPVTGTINLVGEKWPNGELMFLKEGSVFADGWVLIDPPKEAPTRYTNNLKTSEPAKELREYFQAWAQDFVGSIAAIGFASDDGDDDAHLIDVVAKELQDAWMHQPGDGAPPECIALMVEHDPSAKIAVMRAKNIELAGIVTKLIDQVSQCDRTMQVRDFFSMVAPEQERLGKPGIPSVETVRFRVRLIAEEFVELLRAVWPEFPNSDQQPTTIDDIELLLCDLYDSSYYSIKVNLPEFIDACGDLDYVIEGARVAFGVDGRPIAAAIHAANMVKSNGPRRESDGKRLKPEGWKPADVEGLLKEQGWEEGQLAGGGI